jgi:catechol 2,3-dioxygenase-like lactoylglutathione lyase family enzyme
LITGLSHTTIWVLDQDEALAFYTEKLGFEVNTDATMDDFRWLTVIRPAGRSTSSSCSCRVHR